MRFDRRAALAADLDHPEHRRAVETVLRPPVERIVVDDTRER